MRLFRADLADIANTRKLNAWLMAVAFAMLFGAGIAALTLSGMVTRNTEQVVNTHEIRSELRTVLGLMRDAEIGQRGFLLTRDAQYLEPYNEARLQIGQRISALERLVPPDSEQAVRISQLRKGAERRLAEVDQTVALGREGRFGEALAVINQDRGKALMDEIREIVDAALEAERAALTANQAEAIASRTWLSASIIGALAATIVLAILSAQLTRRQFASIEQRRSQLALLNEELEARVRDRTRELEMAREMAEAEAGRAEYERGRVELLLREVTHRVGNNLAMVSSLLRMQQAKLEDDGARSALETARGRIQTISTAQRRLRLGDDLQSTRADSLLEAVIADLADAALESNEIAISGHFDPLTVAARDATTLAVVLGELVSNAIKHAFKGRTCGTISVSFVMNDDGVPLLTVEDDGIGFDETEGKSARRSGLGSMIIENLSRQYGGEIRKWKNEAGGMSIHILLPRLQIVDGEKLSEDRG
ncbi:CHASE3 domain-containing protein [Parvibaculum sp.]|uniref:sensor histidine kinase n=1 Tax=Parvibaculum sp. TaxID=2024848 RepID=UPI001B0DCBFF|nr:CHASE3 domain-containing protein [Parvibaculum sp.]MBO6667919.1 CHASE3 domain-containing protein [Parvibaculum sp.]MBO6690532.1 CHASE3 domain-containing protein [Parvibaculum sp.]MBO6714845.1 CHASE3 domain-containing protein [Parvibaculum sp.]